MMREWQSDTQVSLHGLPALLVMATVMIIIYGIPAMRVVRRTGFAGWWGLLAAVPVVNIVALWVFAFRDWPIENRG